MTDPRKNIEEPKPEPVRDMTAEEEALLRKEVDEQEARRIQDYADDGMELKTMVLHFALRIEYVTSSMLAQLLGLKMVDSELLGHKKRPLDFSQKVQFLIEIGGLDKTSKAKDRFLTFMEIRNMLMHNLRANSLEKCFEMLHEKDGTWKRRTTVMELGEKAIKGLPFPVEVTDSLKLNYGVKTLCFWVLREAMNIRKVQDRRTNNRVQMALNSAIYVKMMEGIYKPFKDLLEEIDNMEPLKRLHKTDLAGMIINLQMKVTDVHGAALHSVKSDDITSAAHPNADRLSWEVLPPPQAVPPGVE